MGEYLPLLRGGHRTPQFRAMFGRQRFKQVGDLSRVAGFDSLGQLILPAGVQVLYDLLKQFHLGLFGCRCFHS
jgi:hypothetical protein